MILDYFQRHKKIVYDIQSFDDDGSDIILYLDEKEEKDAICFQLKSHHELKQKGNGIITKIGGQYAQSMNRYKPIEYYIIPFGFVDEPISKSQTIRDKIRQIRASFSDYDKVTIIDPHEFVYFCKLSSEQIGTIIKLALDPDDLIFNKSLRILKGLDWLERYFFLRLLCLFISSNFSRIKLEEVMSDEILLNILLEQRLRIYNPNNGYDIPKDYKGNNGLIVYYVLQYLDPNFIEIEDENIVVNFTEYEPLIAFILDAKIRGNFSEIELMGYLNNTFIEQLK